jgi:acetylornithine deacetylase
VVIVRDRLGPYEIDAGHPLVRAALDARPGARAFGSRGVSDLVFFRAYPAIKVGPGRTERSHTPDEFVLESEVLDGARFYEALVRRWASSQNRGASA